MVLSVQRILGHRAPYHGGYGDVVTNEMEQAHSRVVQMALQRPN